MKKVSTLLIVIAALMISGISHAQRYLEEVFSEVDVTTNVTYGANASVLTGTPMKIDLKLDVYEPSGDTEEERPLVLYFHTGNFLPHPQNGSPTGLRTDSAAVEICSRLARMGYVVASCDYRLGWNPVAPMQSQRVFTLINAAYRGVQDCRTAVRYFRRSAAEDENPFGIDPERIVVWGQGTGGYISFAAATLSNYDDILLEKFTHEVEISEGVFVPMPMVIEEINGDIYGTSYGVVLNGPGDEDNDTLCYVNHPGYSSDFNLAVNMGGACGDISWIGNEDPPIISFHVPTDPFAPYTTATLIVPVVNLPVVEVSGSYDVQARLNLFGNNDIFIEADEYDPGLAFTEAANANNNNYHGLYPLVRPTGQGNDSAPWEWWASSNPNNNAGLATNPNMSAEKGRAFIDSIQGYAAPRMSCALSLPGNPCGNSLGIDVLGNLEVSVYPNPANEFVAVRSNEEIRTVILRDLTGKTIFARRNLNTYNWRSSDALPASGIYLLDVQTNNGRMVRKLIIE